MEEAKKTPATAGRSNKMREFADRLGAARTAKYGDPSEDWSYIPPEAIPDGCVVQWIVHTIMGQPVQPHEIQRFTMNGWEPYPLELYPSLMPKSNAVGLVERNGQVLYIRRKELHDEARREELNKARIQLRTNKEEFGLGSLKDSNAPRLKPKFKETYEAVPVNE